MKKLLSFLVAGIAALGLASCSGDLHNEFDPNSALGKYLFGDGTVLDKADLCGSIDGWTGSALTKEEDGTYTYTFTADATSGQFSIREVAGSWTAGNRWCGALKKDDDNALKLKNGKSVTLVYSDDPDPSHVQLPELTVGTSYTLTFTIEDDDSISAALSSGSGSGPVPYVLSGLFFRGIEEWEPTLDNCLYNYTKDKDGNVFYKFDITYTGVFAGFKLGSSDWNEGFGGKADGSTIITVDADYIEFPWRREDGSTVYDTSTGAKVENQGDTGNMMVSGMTSGNDYRIYIKTTSEQKVYAKVVSLTSVTVSGATVEVTGLPDEANGKTMYFTGDFNGWATPGDVKTITATVTANKVTITLPDFSNVFEGSETQEFKVQGKFASTGWTKPEICAIDDAGKGCNAAFTLNAVKHKVT